MGNCFDDKQKLSHPKLSSFHGNHPASAHPVKQSDSTYSGFKTSQTVGSKKYIEDLEKKEENQEVRNKERQTKNHEKLNNSDFGKEAVKEDSSCGSEDVDQCDFNLRGTVVESVGFERQLWKAKVEANQLGQLEMESPKKQRKWHRKVAGLSIISEASYGKESSQLGSLQRLSRFKPAIKHTASLTKL